LIIDIQHVGSTSVPRLVAKPTIDIDLVIEDRGVLNSVIVKLEELGYEYQGDLGIKDRESFKRKSDKTPLDGSGRIWQKHNLYCCIKDSISLKNHIQFRDFLRKNPEKVVQYGELKKRLVSQHPFDTNLYTELKTPFITEILKEAGLGDAELESITEQNKMNCQ
jgi:GrpB-like predicted nucleotidyltransferase (UPF0157 family)